jgi:hypothetical protein
MYSQDYLYKLSLAEKKAKRVVTQKEPLGGINDFCDLVRWQTKNPNLKLQEAFEVVVFSTKFN